MSRISQADKQRMYELAEEIIECKRENDHREAMGIGSDSDRICRLYDLSDEEFRAERIKSLLDELKETQAENQRMRANHEKELNDTLMEVWQAAGGKPDFYVDKAYLLDTIKLMDEALHEETDNGPTA